MVFFQGMANNVRFTFSVGDTTLVVYNYYCKRQIEFVTRKTIFSCSIYPKDFFLSQVNP